jgi:hypothetical protein
MYLSFENACDASLPVVFFNKKTKEVEIVGNLYHFKSELLFDIILNWFQLYFGHERKEITLRFDLEIINAKSIKIIYYFLKNIKQLDNCDAPVKVIWLMNSDDEWDRMRIELIKELVPIDFKIHQKMI